MLQVLIALYFALGFGPDHTQTTIRHAAGSPATATCTESWHQKPGARCHGARGAERHQVLRVGGRDG